MDFRDLKELFQGSNFSFSSLMQDITEKKLISPDFFASGGDEVLSVFRNSIEQGTELLSTYDVRLVYYEYSDPNYPDSRAVGKLDGSDVVYKTTKIKSSFITYAKKHSGMALHSYDTFQVAEAVRYHFVNFLGTYLNKLCAAHFKTASLNADLGTGDGLTNFSKALVTSALKKRADRGFENVRGMYMNSNTLYDILDKQAAGTINETLISEYDQTQTTGGLSTDMRSTNMAYRKQMPIILDNALEDGLVVIIFGSPFIFNWTDKPLGNFSQDMGGNAISVHTDELEQLGYGNVLYSLRGAYIMHPIGMSFKGTYVTDYASKSGPTITELKAKSLYELYDTPARVNFLPIRVKVG